MNEFNLKKYFAIEMVTFYSRYVLSKKIRDIGYY